MRGLQPQTVSKANREISRTDTELREEPTSDEVLDFATVDRPPSALRDSGWVVRERFGLFAEACASVRRLALGCCESSLLGEDDRRDGSSRGGFTISALLLDARSIEPTSDEVVDFAGVRASVRRLELGWFGSSLCGEADRRDGSSRGGITISALPLNARSLGTGLASGSSSTGLELRRDTGRSPALRCPDTCRCASRIAGGGV